MNKTGNAYYDFCEMVRNSWTYEKMSDYERSRCWEAIYFATSHGLVKGCYKVRFGILQAVYNAFLIGIGYSDFNWRDTEPEISF